MVGKKIKKGNMKDFDVGTWYKFHLLKKIKMIVPFLLFLMSLIFYLIRLVLILFDSRQISFVI